MLKIGLTATITATLCFGIMAITGFASQDRQNRVISMKVGDRISLQSNNFQCVALSKKQVACGRNKMGAGQVHVYFEPNQLNVLRFNSGTKATVIFKSKR